MPTLLLLLGETLLAAAGVLILIVVSWLILDLSGLLLERIEQMDRTAEERDRCRRRDHSEPS